MTEPFVDVDIEGGRMEGNKDTSSADTMQYNAI